MMLLARLIRISADGKPAAASGYRFVASTELRNFMAGQFNCIRH